MRRGLVVAATALALTACEQTTYLFSADAGALSGRAGAGGLGSGGNGGTSSFGSDAGGTDQHCSGGPALLSFNVDTPQVVIVLDRSSNMSQPFPNSNGTHLAAAVNALFSEVNSYTTQKFNQQRTIRFSFVDFPDVGSGCSGTGECCAKDPSLSVSTANFDVATSCDSPSSSCVASSNRPTDAALIKADQALANSGNNGPRYMLLISDGDPQGCSADDCSLAQKDVANLLAGDHVTLDVVAIQGASSTGCLQDLAMTANATLRSPSYATASDSTTLGQVIGAVISSTLCSGTLTPAPTSSSSLNVTVGNGATGYVNSPVDGWTYDPMSGRLRLHGTMCDAYTQSGGAIFVTSGCTQGHPGPGSSP